MFVKLIKLLSFVPAILLMYMIFTFSAQDGDTSSALSYRVSYTIVSTGDRILNLNLEPERTAHIAERIESVVRKGAHVGEYFLLAIAVAFPLYVYGLHGMLLMLLAGLLCVIYACTDEYHQSFVIGRSPGVRDVLIDSIGIFFGIILVRIIGWTGRMTLRPFSYIKRRRQEKKQEAYEESVKGRYRRLSEEEQEIQSSKYKDDDEEENRPDADILSEDMSLSSLFRNLTSRKKDK